MLRVTVSGSFRRHMTEIYEAVAEFVDRGATVLSPADPRIVDQIGEFVFVASDRVRSIKMVEDRHLDCIRSSDFLWLVAPDGYVGQSASMELGYAIAHNVPIFCTQLPNDGTLRKYVQRVPSLSVALQLAHASRNTVASPSLFLIEPYGAIDIAHSRLDGLRDRLSANTETIRDREGDAILDEASDLAEMFATGTGRCVGCKATT